MLRSRVTFTSALGGAKVSTMHWVVDDSQTHANAVSTALQTFWNAVDNEMVGTTTAIDTELDVVDPTTGVQTGSRTVTAWSLTSAGSGDPLPPGCQILIRWRTGQYISGKEIRGRTFVPNPPEVDNTAGRLLGSIATSITTAATTLAGTTAAGLVVYSKTHHQVASTVTPSVWGDFAYLRSRRD